LSEVVGVRARQNLFVMVQVLGHGDQVVLNIRKIQALQVSASAPLRQYPDSCTHDIRLWRDKPLLITSLGESLDDIRLVAHES
jgi:hypothetical protein